jgi:hypothetical protein
VISRGRDEKQPSEDPAAVNLSEDLKGAGLTREVPGPCQALKFRGCSIFKMSLTPVWKRGGKVAGWLQRGGRLGRRPSELARRPSELSSAPPQWPALGDQVAVEEEAWVSTRALEEHVL